MTDIKELNDEELEQVSGGAVDPKTQADIDFYGQEFFNILKN